MPEDELQQLRARLAEAEAVIAALRAGEVDAIVGKDEVTLVRLRETQQALQESEQRLALAASGTRIGMFEWDVVTGKLLWTEQHARLFGLTTTTTTLSQAYQYRDWAARVHPEDLPLVEAALGRCRAERAPFEAEYRLIWPDGSLHWAVSRGVFHYDAEGRAKRMLGITMDITERKRAEEALRESEERFRTMANGLPLIVWVHDAGGQQEFVNRTFYEYFGVSDEDIHEQRWQALLHPDDADAYTESFLACLRERRPFEAEARVKRADGQWRWIASWSRPRRSPGGEFLGLVGASADVTERKRAEEELRRLNETLEERVAERTSMLKLLNDVATMANEAQGIEEAITYTLKHVSEHNRWCFGHAYLLSDDDPPALVPVRTHYAEAPEKFRPFRAATLRLRLKSGEGLPGRALAARETQWAEDLDEELVARRAEVGRELGLRCGAAFPIFVGGEVAGVLEFFSDKQIEATERLLESMASIGMLLGRVIERQRFERNVARALLAEQQRLGQELHDTVGQEMAGLALVAGRMARRARDAGQPEAAALNELSGGLRQALEHTRDVVRDLLPPTLTHGEDFVGALQELAATAHERHGVACEVKCPRAIPIAAPDVALHLYRIAAEAVANAAKHAQAMRIVLRAAVDEGMLMLEVRDDGIGMPAEMPPRGSGLWIMRHRANAIGATLDIRSGADGGTVVACTMAADQLGTTGSAEA